VEEGEDETPFTTAFGEMAMRLKLWRHFARVDRLGGVGRYGILLIGTRGAEDLKMPLKKLQGPESVIYLQAYHEGDVRIVQWVNDQHDPRYGEAALYKIRASSSTDNFKIGATPELLVHWSRVIHVAEDADDRVHGRPRLERCLNRLTDLEKIVASTGEAYWQSVVRILTANVDALGDTDEAQLKELDERLMEMTHDLRRQFTGQGIKLEYLPTDVPAVKDIGDLYFSLIAAGAGIPQRILFGSEMGELASSTDQQTWFGVIDERQEQFVEPDILRAFIDRMIEFGGLPAPDGGEYQSVWPTLFKETDTEKADLNLKRAQQATTLTPVGGDPRTMVEIDDEGTITLLPQTPEEAEAREEELKMGAPEPPGPPEPDMPESDESKLTPDGTLETREGTRTQMDGLTAETKELLA
ncbi:MAG: anti-CBASS protein Acb1 family protein, partial [Vicinamibacterales bacterium]